MSKASKKRACPAVGRTITSAECGENRVSRYACPADCPYLPFAPKNYSQLLELETRVDKESMKFLLATAPDRMVMERALQKARHDPSPHAVHAFFEWNLFFARDAEGRNCAERLEQSPTANLKNDDHVLLQAKRQTRVALLEIHRVLDTEQLDGVDLLAPDAPPLRLHDRSLVRVANRFATALVWIYPLPHYWRLSGTAIVLPELAQFDPREMVTEIASHLGGPVAEAKLRVWLAKNFVRFDEALAATSRARRMQMFAGLDAKAGKAVYELQAPFAQCREQLDELLTVESDSLAEEERTEGFAEARLWFEEPAGVRPVVPSGRQEVLLGRVLLGQSHWRLEAFGEERLAQLRQKFEAHLAHRVRFTGESLHNLAGNLAAKEPPVNHSLVPPRLLENPQQISISSSRIPGPPPGGSLAETEAEYQQAGDRRFLDDPIPALDDRTPREAARDPALRPRLIRLLKQRVTQHDRRNLQTGGTADINWLLRELGADEIIFPAPPWRPPAEPVKEYLDDLDESDDLFTSDPNLPPAPFLPAQPLSVEEAGRRLEAGVGAFATAADALDSLEASGLRILENADDLTVDLLNDDEFSFATTFILEAALALIPPGHRAPATSYESLQRIFEANLDKLLLNAEKNTPEAFIDFLADSPQPHLVQLLAVQLMSMSVEGPKKLQPRVQAQPVILALIKSVVEELDFALRPEANAPNIE